MQFKVKVKTRLCVILYDAIAASSADLFESAYDLWGVCSVTVICVE